MTRIFRFFHSAAGGSQAVDELVSARWVSGGDLALAQVDRPRG